MSEHEAELVGLTLIKNLVDDEESEQILSDSIELIQKLESDLEQANKLLALIYKDLRMRSDEDYVVNISNFIWEQLKEYSDNE